MQRPKAVMFDLDETLAPSFQPPSKTMIERVGRLLEKLPISIISGAGFERIYDDFLPTLHTSPYIKQLYILANSGSQAFTWADGWSEEYNYVLTEEERSRIKAALAQASEALPVIRDTQSYGERIADREAQVAFTVVGLDAPQEYKMSWDPDVTKRRSIREYLLTVLPDFDIRTGGASTIDITRGGMNKAYGVRWFSERLKLKPEEMLYVGDALYEGGNDAVVIPTGIQTREVSGPAETERIIDELLKACA